MNKIKKRHILLLEVLIAFALIAIGILPLITPYIYMWKAQRHFVDKIQLDHFANLIYVDILQKLYQNEIPWDTIDQGSPIPLNNDLAQAITSLSFKGVAKFTKGKKPKINQNEGRSLYLKPLSLTFTPNWDPKNPLVYTYFVVIDRRLKKEAKLPGEGSKE